MNRKLICAALCSTTLLAGLIATSLVAKDTVLPKPTLVAEKLDNPSGLAVNHKTGHVFIASHAGIFRLVPDKKPVVTPEVTGFTTDIYGKGPKYEIGPLGVAFLDDDHLIVGDGGKPDAEELVRVYKVPAKAPEKPATAGSAAYTLGPIKAGEASAKGEGNFYAVAVTKNAFFVTSNGDDTKGWILKSDIADGKPGELKPFIATKPLVGVDAPVAITTSPDHKQLVVGQMGEINVAGDSLLCFYDPVDGKLLKNFKTGLNDIAGLAYSPKTGKLYAVDFSWMDIPKGGLYRIDIDGDEVKTEKILPLDKPTSLAFDKDGNLYVTFFDTAKPEVKTPVGKVYKIEAGL